MNIYYTIEQPEASCPGLLLLCLEVVPLKSNRRNTRSKSIGTSLSRALVMITVNVINIFSRNKK